MQKTALISVYDKSNLVEFAKELVALDWRIVSTGGTYSLLRENGIDVIDVTEVTNFNEILDGRVKTLHPYIHSGILYRRDDKNHQETIKALNIGSIDMVVNTLYPFEEVLNKDSSHSELIENIDIGGPSMIRAAAKNYKDVIVVTDINDYSKIIAKLKSGELDEEYRLELSAKAFNYTAYYDSLISSYFNDKLGIEFPEKLTLTYQKVDNLRYGENPHQKASYYKKVFKTKNEKNDFKKLNGKELSYNNYTDIYSAVKMVKEFEEPCVVGIKHNNPSGIAIGNTIDEAFDKAYECDKISIFGGIFAINRCVTKHIAEVINSFFMEIVIAPDYEAEALEVLKQKNNLIVIQIENLNEFKISDKVIKEVLGGVVVQDYDIEFAKECKCVTKRQPTSKEMEELLFGFKAVKAVSSNGVVIVKDNATIGIGQGQVRRSWAVEEALYRAEEKIEDAVMASDAFFFEDTVELLREKGIKAVIQPGGSIKDENVIKLCDEYGIAMVMTSTRHFRH